MDRQFRIIITEDTEFYIWTISLQERNEHNGWKIWLIDSPSFEHVARAIVGNYKSLIESFGIKDVEIIDYAKLFEK